MLVPPVAVSVIGAVQRDLFLKPGAKLFLDPQKGPLTIGKNLHIAGGASLDLPRKLPLDWAPALIVNGQITGDFAKPAHAYVKIEDGTLSVKQRPIGTLLLVR